MPGKLTTKQEKFAQEWFATGNKSEAYRRAYDSENMTAKTISERASRLSSECKIRTRYADLMEECHERTATTVDRLDTMLLDAYQVAKEAATPSAMVSAAMALMKLYGHDAETRHKLNFDNKAESMADVLRELAMRLPD